MQKLLTLDEVSEITRLSKATIYAYVAAKKIPHTKLGARVLFDPSMIEEWINKRAVATISVEAIN